MAQMLSQRLSCLSQSRDSGNNFRFPDIESHTGCFCLILVRISSVISFRVDIQQLSLFWFVVYFCLIKLRLSVSFLYLFCVNQKRETFSPSLFSSSLQGSTPLSLILLLIPIVLVLHSPLTSRPSQIAGKGEELRIWNTQSPRPLLLSKIENL